ncbi:hypothetical protein XO10_09335 [Marinitoga sp. 1135]|uniref:Uncharacterized protein n=1 Tax=Marinitoga piezophila (strain DSM 14283 / JCM 11233 / KA3) TaxID=443254 RepID=H2J6C1_MARPK|nr:MULTISPECIES: hypothetical protein [Marinitoga]AEX86269.1 hypothetical protein Marpi_1889 [Marinitoga piezophila KA3]APT76676.1 hypothetical protein LN42_10020 [Marinitoga sp. 1137]NUU96446.1 hypothetical protein [Marinitoga sp. 1135]NUU98367.1 hypothetical protein [Marinitoga sp. 1138]
MIANILFYAGVILIINSMYLFNSSAKELRKGYLKKESVIQKNDKHAFISLVIAIVLFIIVAIFF